MENVTNRIEQFLTPYKLKKENTEELKGAIDAALKSLHTEGDYECLEKTLRKGIRLTKNPEMKEHMTSVLRRVEAAQVQRFSPITPLPPSEFLTKELSYKVMRFIANNPDLLDRKGEYLRQRETGFPFNIQVIDGKRLVIHPKYETPVEGTRMHRVGQGSQTRIHKGEVFGSGQLLAVATPYGTTPENYRDALEALQSSRIILEEFKGQTGVMQLIGHTVFNVKPGNTPKANFLMPLGGYDLYSFLISSQLIPQKIKRTWQSQLLQGMVAIHRAGYIHRDIKPENIIIVRDGKEAVIADFGFATKKITTLNGSINYLAPEVLRLLLLQAQGVPITINLTDKIDIWGLGLVFYLMEFDPPDFLFTRFDPKSFHGVLSYYNAIKNEMETWGPGSKVETWIKGMLEMDPKKRFSAEKALEEFNLIDK